MQTSGPSGVAARRATLAAPDLGPGNASYFAVAECPKYLHGAYFPKPSGTCLLNEPYFVQCRELGPSGSSELEYDGFEI